MTHAGELDQRVRIERVGAKVSDGAGGYTAIWEPVATVWAKVAAQSGSITTQETVAAGQRQSAVQYIVTIRYRDDITAEMRLVWRDKVLNIVGDLDQGRRRPFLDFNCLAGVAI